MNKNEKYIREMQESSKHANVHVMERQTKRIETKEEKK